MVINMKKFKVDTEVIRDSVKSLKQLKETAEEYASVKFPDYGENQGDTHAQIESIEINIIDTWKEIHNLLDRTIDFLTKKSKTVDENDKRNSREIQTIDDIYCYTGYIPYTPVVYHKGEVLTEVWRNYKTVSPNGFTNYNGKGNGTWYVDNRWNQNNPGKPLVFNRNSGRNAKEWVNCINRDSFDVLPTSNSNNIASNTIAVNRNGTWGHVAYVEDVRDGIVYYTEDGETSRSQYGAWGKNPDGTWSGPVVRCCTVEELKSKFTDIISAK